MRVQITHLKAPWPQGAVVGDVLELSEIPVWAVGKCEQVGDEMELTIVVGDDAEAKAEKRAAAEQASEAKAEAIAKATELGIEFDKRWSTARIVEEIAKKTAE